MTQEACQTKTQMTSFVSLKGTGLVGLFLRFQTQPERLMASNEGQTDEVQRGSTI